MRQYCQGLHCKKNVFEWRERKHWNEMQWTTREKMPSGTRWRTAAASSSSCSNSSIATHYTAAGRYIRIHTRTSCSSVQYTSYNRSGPGTLLWNRTRCLVTKRDIVITTHRAAAAVCMHMKLTSRLLRRHLNRHRSLYVFLRWNQKKRNHKEKEVM